MYPEADQQKDRSATLHVYAEAEASSRLHVELEDGAQVPLVRASSLAACRHSCTAWPVEFSASGIRYCLVWEPAPSTSLLGSLVAGVSGLVRDAPRTRRTEPGTLRAERGKLAHLFDTRFQSEAPVPARLESLLESLLLGSAGYEEAALSSLLGRVSSEGCNFEGTNFSATVAKVLSLPPSAA